MSDWRKLSDSEAALLQSCGPDEACMLFEDELIKVSRARLSEMYQSAVHAAIREACRTAGITDADQLADCKLDPIDTDKPYLRVTVTSTNGKTASASGMIPDPRLN